MVDDLTRMYSWHNVSTFFLTNVLHVPGYCTLRSHRNIWGIPVIACGVCETTFMIGGNQVDRILSSFWGLPEYAGLGTEMLPHLSPVQTHRRPACPVT